MRQLLTIECLIEKAKKFCEQQTRINHVELMGITDGKAVGTYVEHKFKNYLLERYNLRVGNSASGIDLPSSDINTDIKVTSIRQPQSSSPTNLHDKKYSDLVTICLFLYMTKSIQTTFVI